MTRKQFLLALFAAPLAALGLKRKPEPRFELYAEEMGCVRVSGWASRLDLLKPGDHYTIEGLPGVFTA